MGSKRKPTWAEDGWGEWGGYMNAKIQKLQEQYATDLPRYVANQSENNKSSIFKGIAIFVNGYTVPSADGLKRLMMLHGGIYHHYYNKTSTTHIIATNLAAATVKGLTSEKIVRPEWITDSVKAGYLLPYQDYQLLYQKAKNQQQLPFKLANGDHITYTEDSTSGDGEINKDGKNSESLESDKLDSLANSPNTSAVASEQVKAHPSANRSESIVPKVSTAESIPSTSIASTEPLRTRTAICATNSKFLSEFYGHSRLHYLSTMGAEFREYVNQLRINSDGSFPGRIRIKAWKARRRLMSKKMAKSQVGEKDNSTPDSSLSLPGKQRVIMHIDMDCFFVSVGIRDHPELKGQPVVVAHSRGTGFAGQANSSLRETELEYYRQNKMLNSKSRPSSVILQEVEHDDQNDEEVYKDNITNAAPQPEEFLSSSEIACCSYEARQAGLRNGMFLGEAKKLCPNLKTISYNFEGYREVSYTLYNTVASYTHNIEAVSCDELYVDCTDILYEMAIGPLDFASILRSEVLEKTRCSCSAGLSSNMLMARLATRKAKPNGQYFLSKEFIDEFICPQSVKDLPGVGGSLGSRLKALNVTTCAELQKISLSVLQKEFGPRIGQVLHNSCRGIDDRQVKPEHQRKSVSADVNYGIRFTKEEEVEKFMLELSEEVAKRLDSVKMKGKTLTLKLKVRRKHAPAESSKFMGHGICDTITKSTSLNHPISDALRINHEVMNILKTLRIPPEEMRGVGIQMQRLETCGNSTSNNATLLKFLQKSMTPTLADDKTSATSPLSCNSISNLSECLPNSKVKVRENRAEFTNSLPPPSQVDFEVLSELPEDLRQQIFEDYASRGVKLDLPCVTQHSSSESKCNTPGTSTDTPRTSTTKSQVPISSIDQSFYQALPPEIQEEVKEMLLQQERNLLPSPTKPNLKLLSSPEKRLLTPPKANRGSPARRGRKPKSGIKKNSSPKINAQQPKIFSIMGSTRMEERIEPVAQFAKIVSNSEKPHKLKANLCGAVEIADVKQLIQEWINDCPNPEAEDVETISRYLKGLIIERNLEMVDLVAKYLYRIIVKTDNQEWKGAYSAMLEDVQKLAVVLHEAPLKMPQFCTADS